MHPSFTKKSILSKIDLRTKLLAFGEQNNAIEQSPNVGETLMKTLF